jgi:hypothetical protein
MTPPVKLGLYGIYDPEVWRNDEDYTVHIKDGDQEIRMTADTADKLMKWLKETKYKRPK